MPQAATSDSNASAKHGQGNHLQPSDFTFSRPQLLLTAAFAFFDGLNASSSTNRIFWDILYQNNNLASAYAMREWMMSQEGIEVVTIESFFLITLSMIANLYAEFGKRSNKDGYKLALMSSLPDMDMTQAKSGCIYMSSDRNYIVRDLNGTVHQGRFPESINLDNLDTKLRDPNFKKTIMAITSKSGHTRPYRYSLALMASLPDRDIEQTESGKIYLSADGSYIVRDRSGMVHEGLLPESINLDNLDARLNDANLRKAIIAITAQNGHTHNDKKNTLLKETSVFWCMVRDILKGIKNAYKAGRTGALVAELCSRQDYHFLIIPLGLTLGALSSFNRIFYRNIEHRRGEIKAANEQLLKEIQKTPTEDQTWVHLLDELPAPEYFKDYENSYILLRNNAGKSELYYVENTVKTYNYLENESVNEETFNLITIKPGRTNYRNIVNDFQDISNGQSRFLFNQNQIRRCITTNTANYESVLVNDPRTLLNRHIKRNKIYISLVDGLIQYTVRKPNGDRVTSKIPRHIIACGIPLVEEEMLLHFPKILAIAAEAGHLYTGHTKYQSYYKRIENQTNFSIYAGVTSKIYSGVVDGAYLFMGVPILAAMSAPLTIMVTAFSISFTFACMLSRYYEDYRKRQEILASADKVRLAICGKELKSLFAELQYVYSELIFNENNEVLRHEYATLVNALPLKIEEFETHRKALKDKLTQGYIAAIGEGLTDGLAVFGVVAATIFSFSTIALVLGQTVSPVLVLSCVAFGVACLVGFVGYYLAQHAWQTWENQQRNAHENSNQLMSLLSRIKSNLQDVETMVSDADKTIADRMNVDKITHSSIPSYSEVGRSLGAALGKGPKACEFTMGTLQEVDSNGRIHDSPLLMGIMLIVTPIYALVLGLVAYRERILKTNSRDSKETAVTDSNVEPTTSSQTNAAKSAPRVSRPTFRRENAYSENSWYSFYGRPRYEPGSRTAMPIQRPTFNRPTSPTEEDEAAYRSAIHSLT